jgi:hypothetical protein
MNGSTSTIAGRAGYLGSGDGLSTVAFFRYPRAICASISGDAYIADGSHNIRLISPLGYVSTVAGSSSSQGYQDGTLARFNNPLGIAMSPSGTLVVADAGNSVIRLISPSRTVTTFAGLAGATGADNGIGSNARFFTPASLVFAPSGTLYLYDNDNNNIRVLSPTASVTTLAGNADADPGFNDGSGTAALFGRGMAQLAFFNGSLFLTDVGNCKVRSISLTGVVRTIAGGGANGVTCGQRFGLGTQALFTKPGGIVALSSGDLVVSDANILVKINASRAVNFLSGSFTLSGISGYVDGTGTSAGLS